MARRASSGRSHLDEPVGNTVHVMTEAIDEGPIVEIERCPVVPGERYTDVRVNMYARGYALMARSVQKILNGDIPLAELPAQGTGRFFRPMDQATIAEVIKKLEEGRYRAGLP